MLVYATMRKILLPVFRNKFNSINGIENIPEKGPYIIASNHIDFLDGPFISFAFYLVKKHTIYFLSKTKNYWWARTTLPIDPNNKKQSIEDAVKYLKEGKIICNFIEGRRNSKNHLLKGKTGTVRMALIAKVPILPVGIIGQEEKNFAKSVTKMLTRDNHVIINIGKLITFGDYYREEINKKLLENLTHKIMGKIAPLCKKVYIF